MVERSPATTQPAGTQAAARVCWECKATLANAHFCPACGKLQLQLSDTDYFSFFGLPRKLNLELDKLEEQFHQLSWKLHPDNFSQATAYERELSLKKSALLNDAYRTLRDPIARALYLLGLEGVGRSGEGKPQAPPDLLEEVLELNECLDQLRKAKRASASAEADAKQVAELRQRLQRAWRSFEVRLAEVEKELLAYFRDWDALVDAGAPEAERKARLNQISEILNRHSYIHNLVRNVQEELEE